MHRFLRRAVAVVAFFLLSLGLAAVAARSDPSAFPRLAFLVSLLMGFIFVLAGLAQWSQFPLRLYGTPQGKPWGADIAAFGAPGLRKTSPLGPALPWEGRQDLAGRNVVFSAVDGLTIGGALLALAFVMATL